MKTLKQNDSRKTKGTNKLVSLMGVKMLMGTLLLATLTVSCNKEEIANGNTSQTNTAEQANRIYHSIIVRNWGSHNIDCSQPNGFCYDVWTFSYRSLFIPQPEGTPATVDNVNGQFMIKVFKSALTKGHLRTLLRSQLYSIPEDQKIVPELVRALNFSSENLKYGNYKIEEDVESYTIRMDVQ
jgi:hypothetical protein